MQALRDQPRQVGPGSLKAFFNLLKTALHLGRCEITVAVIDGFKLAAIDCHNRMGEQRQASAKHDELSTDAANCCAIILSEVGSWRSTTTSSRTNSPWALGLNNWLFAA